MAKIDPFQPLGAELFNAIFRVSVGIAIETVAIRRNSETGKVEVFLTWRNETAPTYKNTWHVPGSYMRPGETIKKTIERIARDEFKCSIKVIKDAGWKDNPTEERGSCVHLVFLVGIGEPKNGKWFPVNELPSETIEHHRHVVIPIAVEAFKSIS